MNLCAPATSAKGMLLFYVNTYFQPEKGACVYGADSELKVDLFVLKNPSEEAFEGIKYRAGLAFTFHSQQLKVTELLKREHTDCRGPWGSAFA